MFESKVEAERAVGQLDGRPDGETIRGGRS